MYGSATELLGWPDNDMSGCIEWEPSVRATCVHALKTIHEQRNITDNRLQAAWHSFSGDVRSLTPTAPDWQLAFSWAAGEAQASLPPGWEELLARIEACLLSVHPQLSNELRLRMRPIRDQWETRGPGLLKTIAQHIGYSVPFNGQIVLVHPLRNGWGFAVPKYGFVFAEAVLVNPHCLLPEVLRLAWCITQIMLAETSSLGPSLSGMAAKRASILPCLAAGEYLDLCQVSQDLIVTALRIWCDSPASRSEAGVIWEWWTGASRPIDWRLAISDLNCRFAD